MQCYEGQVMTLFFQAALKRAGIDALRDELYIWDVFHEAGLENLSALQALDEPQIRDLIFAHFASTDLVA